MECLNNKSNLILKRDNLESQNKKLSRNVRWLIFIILFLTTIFINMDHGTIPAATKDIKLDLNIDNNSLGIFGSLVFFGNLLGI
jgi:hypothetical protein